MKGNGTQSTPFRSLNSRQKSILEVLESIGKGDFKEFLKLRMDKKTSIRVNSEIHNTFVSACKELGVDSCLIIAMLEVAFLRDLEVLNRRTVLDMPVVVRINVTYQPKRARRYPKSEKEGEKVKARGSLNRCAFCGGEPVVSIKIAVEDEIYEYFLCSGHVFQFYDENKQYIVSWGELNDYRVKFGKREVWKGSLLIAEGG